MAWTAPMTFTSNTVLTAAQLNTHLRDNLLETAPAKATTAAGYFVTTGMNAIVERVIRQAFVNPTETTTSNSFTDLTTPGPAVTAGTGSEALVLFAAQLTHSAADFSLVSVEVSGASSISPSDDYALASQQGTSLMQSGHFMYFSNLVPGTNTFTLKYRVGSGTGSFRRRRIVVMPF